MNQKISKGGNGEHQPINPEMLDEKLKSELSKLSNSLAAIYTIMPGGMTLTFPVFQKKLIITKEPQQKQIGVLHITKPLSSLALPLTIQMIQKKEGE